MNEQAVRSMGFRTDALVASSAPASSPVSACLQRRSESHPEDGDAPRSSMVAALAGTLLVMLS